MIMNDQNLKDAWAAFPTGVSIITSKDFHGECHGMTANSIMSFSIDPPLVLISVAKSRESNILIKKHRKFGLNILNSDQNEIANFYSAPSEKKIINKINWDLVKYNEVYLISNSLVKMACNVVKQYDHADHTLFIGSVFKLEVEKRKPLIWYDRKYAELV
tara:strand:+ start:465 stop:944 length:480 start_codon:yes stop_codon:yes gene_type:complete